MVKYHQVEELNQGNQDEKFIGNANLRKCLVCVVSKDENFRGARIDWGSGIVGHVAATGRPLNISDAYSDPLFDPVYKFCFIAVYFTQASDKKTGFTTKSILTIPITDSDGIVVAVLQAVNRLSTLVVKQSCESSSSVDSLADRFYPEDVALLESMGVSAGTLLKKSKLFTHAGKSFFVLTLFLFLVASQRKTQGLMKLVKVF